MIKEIEERDILLSLEVEVKVNKEIEREVLDLEKKEIHLKEELLKGLVKENLQAHLVDQAPPQVSLAANHPLLVVLGLNLEHFHKFFKDNFLMNSPIK